MEFSNKFSSQKNDFNEDIMGEWENIFDILAKMPNEELREILNILKKFRQRDKPLAVPSLSLSKATLLLSVGISQKLVITSSGKIKTYLEKNYDYDKDALTIRRISFIIIISAALKIEDPLVNDPTACFEMTVKETNYPLYDTFFKKAFYEAVDSRFYVVLDKDLYAKTPVSTSALSGVLNEAIKQGFFLYVDQDDFTVYVSW